MGAGETGTGYRIVFDPEAVDDLHDLDPPVREHIAEKIEWLKEHAEQIGHQRLKGLPKDLRGLCRYRVGDYRVLYWIYPGRRELRIYAVIHRRTAYGILR